ncbi:hypothetical protein L195_g026240 [Trifolium pratense]|uniref:Uncharacterized protein n=1 Tax=Trifolium pratense TaxID=57577 RepID=A0A2K3LF01_TRIPR|nr:hypothetical protein L195_g033085 [Trifolium pratense]PNX88497.1 hypothetical protein L195_g044603 [Trifolium pratense]PNY02919.1 hypothetical protein L195_g026240 [Trifolium pratense]
MSSSQQGSTESLTAYISFLECCFCILNGIYMAAGTGGTTRVAAPLA